jgi:hypothetical protein
MYLPCTVRAVKPVGQSPSRLRFGIAIGAKSCTLLRVHQHQQGNANGLMRIISLISG